MGLIQKYAELQEKRWGGIRYLVMLEKKGSVVRLAFGSKYETPAKIGLKRLWIVLRRGFNSKSGFCRTAGAMHTHSIMAWVLLLVMGIGRFLAMLHHHVLGMRHGWHGYSGQQEQDQGGRKCAICFREMIHGKINVIEATKFFIIQKYRIPDG